MEATGSSNPLGWTPSDFEDGQWTAYPITNSSVFPAEPEQFQPTSASIPSVSIPGFPLESIVVGLLLAIGVIYVTKKKSLTSLPMSQKTLGQTL